MQQINFIMNILHNYRVLFWGWEGHIMINSPDYKKKKDSDLKEYRGYLGQS